MTNDIKVIGAGFGRTGTMTLMTALNTLGFTCHHMSQVVKHKQAKLWRRAVADRAAGRRTDWGTIFGPGGYDAAVDWPAAAFYKELMEAYPNAKVILTVRDFDSWYTSIRNTIHASGAIGMAEERRIPAALAASVPYLAAFKNHYCMVREVIWEGTFASRVDDKDYVRQVYESHLAEVRRAVPPSRLLEFSPRDGWAPLCAFLGVPPPEGEPFPHVNDTEEFGLYIESVKARARRCRAIVVGLQGAAAAAAAVGVALVVRVVRAGRS